MSRLILGMRQAEPSAALREAIVGGRLAGLLWFREALGESVATAAERTARIRSLWPPGIPCLFAADEEGGLIQQLNGLREDGGTVWPRLPSARALGRSGDAGLAFAHGREVGRRMRLVGLDVALAPVVDLDPGPESAVLGTRCWGNDPVEVARLALAWARGLSSAGVLCCLKHYPGHGATRVDSHRELPAIPSDADEAGHLLPFEGIARDWREADGPPPAVLTAHVVRAGSELPVTLDPLALSRVPAALGPIWTDSLDMGALAPFGDLKSRGCAAIAAGSDLLVIGLDIDQGLAAAGNLAAPPSPRVERWSAGRLRVPPPAPWPAKELGRAAAAGVRVVHMAPMPEGGWEWLLPERCSVYGAVADPPRGTAPYGKRWIVRVTRYEEVADRSLRDLIERAAHPVLFGWIHRGAPDPEIERALRLGNPRLGAIAHLLDGPRIDSSPGPWRAETSGFGEGEIAALLQTWQNA